ncbi:MAG: hypothetical protein AB7O97_13635 [Planctomycetota bacterium]
MDLRRAVDDILLGASLRQVAQAYRQSLIEQFEFRPDEITASTFARETEAFMKTVARHLGDRHRGEPQVQQALFEWVAMVEHYEAWDALLAGFEFPGKSTLIRRGRVLFPGPLTAHWYSEDE